MQSIGKSHSERMISLFYASKNQVTNYIGVIYVTIFANSITLSIGEMIIFAL